MWGQPENCPHFAFVLWNGYRDLFLNKKELPQTRGTRFCKWGNVRAIDKKYRQKPLSENKLMTQNVCIGLNAKKHRRNLNTLVCGGSGAGKTRFYAKPN